MVNHGQVLSNLYVSTKISPYKVEFVVSLERVMFYNPAVTWTNSWLADTAGDKPFADVYKIQGLRGIYIANQITKEYYNKNKEAGSNIENDHMRKGTDSIRPDDLVSLVTFNQGGSWRKVDAPTHDENGHKLSCDVKTNHRCSLHLSQQLSKKFPTTRSIPILSSRSAIGIVMGTGNVGTTLAKMSNVYLSADAGLSWHQVEIILSPLGSNRPNINIARFNLNVNPPLITISILMHFY